MKETFQYIETIKSYSQDLPNFFVALRISAKALMFSFGSLPLLATALKVQALAEEWQILCAQ